MANELIKYFASDGVERGRQFFALAIQLLQRGASPSAVVTMLSDVQCKDGQKYVDGAQKSIQSKRTRDFNGVLSPDCLAACASAVGVSLGRSFTLHVGEDIRAIPIPKAIVAGRFSRNSL